MVSTTELSFMTREPHSYSINYNGSVITITGITPDDESTIRQIAYNHHVKLREESDFIKSLEERFPNAVVDTYIKGNN